MAISKMIIVSGNIGWYTRHRLSRRLIGFVGLCLSFFACQPKPLFVRPALHADGAVYAYMAPYPQEAQQLTFRISSISALREGGERHPLSILLPGISSKEVKRERLLAVGELPPGRYTGLALKVEQASLKTEEGETKLAPSEESSEIAVSFVVARKEAVVLSLNFRYRESLLNGFRFTPVFSAMVPIKPPINRIGLASSRGANNVTQFDKSSGRVVAVIPTGRSPVGMALDIVNLRAYSALTAEDAVEVIDVVEGAVIGRVRLAAGDAPVEVALTPDGNTLLSANSGSNTVSVIDPSAQIETNRIRVGVEPRSILIDRTGRRAYVFNSQSNSISVLDIPQGLVVATVVTETEPVRGQLSRDGSRLYVQQRGSPYLGVFDPVSLSTVRRIHVGSGGTALKVDPRTDLIYLSRRFSDEIEVYDPFSALPIDTIRAGGETAYLTIDGEGNNLVIVLSEQNRIRLVRLVGKETVAEIDIGEYPFWVSLPGER